MERDEEVEHTERRANETWNDRVPSYDDLRAQLSTAKAEIERLRRHIEKALQLLEPGSTECGRCDLTIEISNPEAVAELQAALAKQGGSDG